MQMDRDALQAFFDAQFPQVGGRYAIESVGEVTTLRLRVSDANLRPGGTINGPSMFELADLTVYAAILARIGPVALAVTTNASIDFMRKPEAGRDLMADCRLLKLGRVLAVGDVLIHSEGRCAPVARASLTYSIPPKR